LDLPFSKEDVNQALFSINDEQTLGLYGNAFGFYNEASGCNTKQATDTMILQYAMTSKTRVPLITQGNGH